MAKIVYLLGAGASYGKRNENELPTSINKIEEGLPIVKEINNEIDVVVEWIKSVAPIDNILYSHKGGNDFNGMKNGLINDFCWLATESMKYDTIDSFARHLYLNNDYSNYERLKLLLTSFFLIEQFIHKSDSRYRSFFTKILDSDKRIPDNLYILTWNYDCQMDIAYREFSHWPLSLCIPTDPYISDSESFNVFKLNGTANFFRGNYLEPQDLLLHDSQELLDFIFKRFQDAYYPEKGYRPYTDLCFAWEREEFNKRSKGLFQKIKDTEVLVVIGYTFPRFNQDTDKEIFENMPNLHKVYIQDPNAYKISEDLYSTFIETKKRDFKIKLCPRTNISSFILPSEL